jgi:hypothetical protein
MSEERNEIAEPAIKTPSIGNSKTGNLVEFIKKGTSVSKIRFHWDNDKIRGVAIQFFGADQTEYSMGDTQEDSYDSTTYWFSSGERLDKVILRDSGYGYRSFRSFRIETTKKSVIEGGHDGSDNHIEPDCQDTLLLGIYGTVNPDNFVNSFGLYITKKIARIECHNVKYDLDKINKGTPSILLTSNQTIKGTKAKGTTTLTQKYSSVESSSWSQSWGVREGTSVMVKAGVPIIGVDTEVTVSKETEYNYYSGKEVASALETEWQSNIENSEKDTTVSFNAIGCDVTVPYSADITVFYCDQTSDRYNGFSGVLTQKNVFDITIDVKQ